MECPQLKKVNLLLDLKDELKSAIDTRTSWGKNQLYDLLDTIFDNALRKE